MRLDLRTSHSALRTLVFRVRGLHLYRAVLEDELGAAFLTLLEKLAATDAPVGGPSILESYARLFSLLASEAEVDDPTPVGDPWQNHLLDRLLFDDNPFSREAQKAPIASMSPSLLEAAANDLRTLQDLFRLGGDTMAAVVAEQQGDEMNGLVSWSGLRCHQNAQAATRGLAWRAKLRLASSQDWGLLLPDLAEHYASQGSGVFARFRAFRWVPGAGTGRIEGVAHPDPVRLENLVEYDAERALLLQNTEQFVRGFRANNALLYGERGTGKSSTVKALLQRYGDQGLRLVEVPKGLLAEFPRILALLRGRRERFVLFVDDLSFDDRETAYKESKAVLEGGLEARPDNVVVYATSNRRHLVQERFSDRAGGDGEIRGWDSHQEKLSLADRFGITLVFAAPDQERYLRIVESLARQAGLEIGVSALRSRALQWAAHQGGFSGRTARQFVDHLAGELGVESLHSHMLA